MNVTDTLGYKLANPGDIRIVPGITYLGEVTPSSDKQFRQFQSATFGLRAILEILLAYVLHDGVTTVGAAIARYAPPTENDTAAYQAAVCSDCGVPSDTAFTLAWLHTHAQAMVRAIVTREIGGFPYPDSTLELAVSMAMDD